MWNSIDRKLLHLEVFRSSLDLHLHQSFKRDSEVIKISSYWSLRKRVIREKRFFTQTAWNTFFALCVFNHDLSILKRLVLAQKRRFYQKRTYNKTSRLSNDFVGRDMQNSINRKLLHFEVFQNSLSLDLYENFKRGSEAINISKNSSLKNTGTSHKDIRKTIYRDNRGKM